MEILLEKIGKHYNRQWLFRDISFKLQAGESVAILGKNGSGKSTLLQIIAGLVKSSAGDVQYAGFKSQHPHDIFSITSPLLVLPQDFTMAEIIAYQKSIGRLNYSPEVFAEHSNFTKKQIHQPVALFSSGMQQRLKTALCLLSENPVKLLDEPLTNMDHEGEIWYSNCLGLMKNGHILIVAGNNEKEYKLINNHIRLSN